MSIINFIVEPPTICPPDQRAVTELGNNEGLHKYTTLFKPYIFTNT